MRRSSEQVDEEERILVEIEEDLEADVQALWKVTRQGPHDDCDCHSYHVGELRHAIKRLRAFRRGVYWA